MAHETSEAGEGRGFHFVVGDAASIVFEALDEAVEVGIGQGQAQFTSLRAVEADGRDGVAAHHVVTAYAVDEFSVGIDNIGFSPKGIPVGVVTESFFKTEVGHLVAAGVVVEHTVKAD